MIGYFEDESGNSIIGTVLDCGKGGWTLDGSCFKLNGADIECIDQNLVLEGYYCSWDMKYELEEYEISEAGSSVFPDVRVVLQWYPLEGLSWCER